MTLFYISEDKICSIIKEEFEFFDLANFESISDILGKLNLNYNDDQIGFIIPYENNDFPKDFKNFLQNSYLQSEYFFSIIVKKEKSSDAKKRFLELCKKFNIDINYLEFVENSDDQRKIKDKSIAMRTEIGLFVNKNENDDIKSKIKSLLEWTISFIKRDSSQND